MDIEISSVYSDEIICLNVGGKRFDIRRSTIDLIPDSLLAKCFNGDFKLPEKDANGLYFFDRDPVLFSLILEVYRSGMVVMPFHVHPVVFDNELEYWGISGSHKKSRTQNYAQLANATTHLNREIMIKTIVLAFTESDVLRKCCSDGFFDTYLCLWYSEREKVNISMLWNNVQKNRVGVNMFVPSYVQNYLEKLRSEFIQHGFYMDDPSRNSGLKRDLNSRCSRTYNFCYLYVENNGKVILKDVEFPRKDFINVAPSDYIRVGWSDFDLQQCEEERVSQGFHVLEA